MSCLSSLNLIRVLRSKYCQISFIVFFILSIFLIPSHVLHHPRYIFEVIIFMLLFSLNITCTIFDIKQKIQFSRPKGKSLFTFVIGILGLSALQFCGLGGLTCSGTLLITLFSTILPRFLFDFMMSYSIWILRASIVFQLFSLYNLKCFVTKNCTKNESRPKSNSH